MLIGLASGILVSISFYFGFFSGLENFFEDRLFSSKPINGDIIIVEIDNESIQRLGQWPWPRNVFAEAIDKLKNNPPKVLGVDVIFPENSRLGKKDDEALAISLQSASFPIIMPIEADPLKIENGETKAEKTVTPLEIFSRQPSVTLAHVNLILDNDGLVRKVPSRIFDTASSNWINAFAYEVVKKSKLSAPDPDNIPPAIDRIVFSGPTGAIKRIPFWKILDGSASKETAGKMLFLGSTAPDLHDDKITPVGRGSGMPGVEIQANIANMLISGYRLSPLNQTYSTLLILLSAIAPSLFFAILKRGWKAILASLSAGIIQVIVIIIVFEKGTVINLIHTSGAWIMSTAGILIYRYFFGEKERAQMKKIFSKYVSRDVLDVILKDPEAVRLGGEEKEVTVFFSDIRGFTTLSEKTTPQELVLILNQYFTAMTEEVLRRRGVLDKYIGDAIMAFWGAPVEDQNQADNALMASLAMIKKLKILNEKFKSKGKPEINIGIGLYTGPAIVGNIGAETRFDYTVIGDTVNVASRLEGLNKEFKTNIIIGESTKNKLRGQYSFQSLGSVSVKGRKEPLNIYTVNEQY